MKKFLAAILTVVFVLTSFTMVSFAEGDRLEFSFNFIRGVRDISRQPYVKADSKVLFNAPVDVEGHVVKYFNNGKEIKGDISSPVPGTVALTIKEGYNMLTAKLFTNAGVEVEGTESLPITLYGVVYVGINSLSDFTAQVQPIDMVTFKMDLENPSVSPKEKAFIKSLTEYDEATKSFGRNNVAISVAETTGTNSPCQRIKPPYRNIWTVQYDMYMRGSIAKQANLNQVRIKQPSNKVVGDPFDLIIKTDNSLFCNGFDTLLDVTPDQWNNVQIYTAVETDSLDAYYNNILMIKDYDMAWDIDYSYANNFAGFSIEPNMYYSNQKYRKSIKCKDLPDLTEVARANRVAIGDHFLDAEFTESSLAVDIYKELLPRDYREKIMVVAMTADGKTAAQTVDMSLIDAPEIATLKFNGSFNRVVAVRLSDYAQIADVVAP